MAIGIKVKKAPEDYDLGASKFFGSPTIPQSFENDFSDDEMFFCQIKLSDIAHLDKDNRLPHTGYLYIFLNTEDGHYSLRARVRYTEDEPEVAIDEFNSSVEGYEDFTDAFLMEFFPVDDSECCTRLFGCVSDWNYEDEPPALLLQFDPLDNDMGFLDFLDGFLYFFYGEDEGRLEDVFLTEEYS